MRDTAARLADLGLELPALRPRAGDYVGWVQAGELLFLSGQGSEGHVGRVGENLDIEAGRRAARASMLNLLAQTEAALGTLDRVARVVKVLGFVACTPDFRELPRVLDGASELLRAVLGDEAGAHARSAIGAAALPLGFTVEIEMVVQVAAA